MPAFGYPFSWIDPVPKTWYVKVAFIRAAVAA